MLAAVKKIPNFGLLDIISLPNWQGYARMQQGGDTVPPFSFHSLKDETPYNEDLASKVKELSRLRYGADIETVERNIHLQRTFWRKKEEARKD